MFIVVLLVECWKFFCVYGRRMGYLYEGIVYSSENKRFLVTVIYILDIERLVGESKL